MAESRGRSVEAAFEIVLHSGGTARIADAFAAYARSLGAQVLMDKRRTVGGLTFVPIRSASARVEEIARFSFVRVARAMPGIRPIPRWGCPVACSWSCGCDGTQE